MSFYHYYLILSLVFVLLRTLQGQECSTAGLQPYRDCVLNNSPCPCGACDPDPTDGTPTLVTPQPKSCDDVQRIFCGLVRCCSVCEAEALAWYQTCTVDPFSLQTLNYTCELKCDFQPYLDQCVPTTLPTFRPTRSPVILTESPSVAPVILSAEPSIVVTESPTAVLTASPTISITNNQTDGGTVSPVLSNTSGIPTSSATRSWNGFLWSSTLALVMGQFRVLF